MATVRQCLDANNGLGPGFHLLRHLLSFVILAHHCRVAVFGIDRAPAYAKGQALGADAASALTNAQLVIELLRPGLYALVGMFFALSGFLVIGSAIKNSDIKVFFTNRALRILPALSVEVTLSAVVLGACFTVLPIWQYYADPQFFRYFGNIVGHVSFELPGVFENLPWPHMVNASLWTLPPEFWCYFIVLVVMVAGLMRNLQLFSGLVIAASGLAVVLTQVWPGQWTVYADSTHYTAWYIVLMFLFGALFFVNAHRVPLSWPLFLACGAGYFVMSVMHWLPAASGLLLTYCMVWIGMQRFPWFDRWLKQDLSYGIYLYGFPITQAVIAVMLPFLGDLSRPLVFGVIFPIVLGLTALFAMLSWQWIEKPALALRHRVLRSTPRAAARAA